MVILVLNAPLADPLFDLHMRDVEVLCDIVFIYIVLTDVLFDFAEELLLDTRPVSYTHLDVYKRQAQLFHAIGMRDVETSVFCMNHLENRLMLAAFAVGISLQMMVTEVPYFVQLFGTCRLTALEWTKLLGLAAMPLLAHELLVLFSCAGEVKDALRLQGEDVYKRQDRRKM